MEGLGLPGDRISATGIPVEPGFAQEVDRGAVLRRHGLDPAKPMVLVAGGSLGLSPATAVVRQLLHVKSEFQTVVVCGRNKELEAGVRALTVGREADFRVFGYTGEMADFMGAASVLMSKPGGMTTAEALARGLPMLILDPIGGQEERNSDVLLEAGAALKCSELTLVGHKLRRLLDEPGLREKMSANASALGRPRAAGEIARIVLEGPERKPVVISKLREKVLRKRVVEGA